MPKEIISTPEAPQSPMYSQAVKAGHTIYVAGTTGVDVTTGEFAGATVKEQGRQSLLNCQAILRAAGAGLSDAVMVHTLLMRPEDADDLAEVFDEFFPDVRPPRCVSKIGVDGRGSWFRLPWWPSQTEYIRRLFEASVRMPIAVRIRA